jgi:hypothetical protein
MVRTISVIPFALAALSMVSGFAVPNKAPPTGWNYEILEVRPSFIGFESSFEAFSFCRITRYTTGGISTSTAKISMEPDSFTRVATLAWYVT